MMRPSPFTLCHVELSKPIPCSIMQQDSHTTTKRATPPLSPPSNRLNITLLDGYAYGKYLGNGTYGGMVGALQSGAADLTVSEVSITADRQRVIGFSSVLSVIRWGVGGGVGGGGGVCKEV